MLYSTNISRHAQHITFLSIIDPYTMFSGRANLVYTLCSHILQSFQRKEVHPMGLVGWIILGALAGWIASMFTGNNRRMGLAANIIVGVIGSSIGGFVFNLLGGHGVTGLNLWSLIVAVVGSVILLTVANAIRK
jgi:uncharacterized membrane protein YeaQ/YmgE (transglycosylase-associated protein family)